ncbi:30S ribosomal protein S21 [Orientia tsutsugamushi]|uniref:Small ribosomal subunit protein bS21 n=4 Tax=Orientia tsutsugamushi TaxID=784 RepID=RS21_ORITI|nr:30S ribosomal protein S21 [Orientia tsutsugamushi]B3CTW5.1 RecName: Full=Small ribosomal subunit protein bS21; AltName: Full=30S ribosomal protein S21 [Orientia tsutsugamushi str. Ikeda]KJV73905.1 ribosomal protein S21 [Orientia tsutsugamushi str. TA763]KJV88418.1 ribosomal protein S21 [Orientia tsutsugamushi str. UT76]KJW01895.1 ribosomal protein S21 [Orientia tsutsugamushi str. Sido]KJV53801.1 ribosomal protein S21 [Orientia tsutsugamushi str. Gilliam]KJV56078.1 ribosomal protein S21 [Or
MIHVPVNANNSELAIRSLKKKMQRELVFRSMKMSRFYEPPSVKRVRKKQESERRHRKERAMRRRMMEE